MTALKRAIASGNHNDVAILVGKTLGLNVTRLLKEFLNKALAATECGNCFASSRLKKFGNLVFFINNLDAATSATECGFDGNRKTVLLHEFDDLAGTFNRVDGSRC